MTPIQTKARKLGTQSREQDDFTIKKNKAKKHAMTYIKANELVGCRLEKTPSIPAQEALIPIGKRQILKF